MTIFKKDAPEVAKHFRVDAAIDIPHFSLADGLPTSNGFPATWTATYYITAFSEQDAKAKAEELLIAKAVAMVQQSAKSIAYEIKMEDATKA